MSESERKMDVTVDSAEISEEQPTIPLPEQVKKYFEAHPIVSFVREDVMRGQGYEAIDEQYQEVLADLAELDRMIESGIQNNLDMRQFESLVGRRDTLREAKDIIGSVRTELSSDVKKRAVKERVLFEKTVAEKDRDALYAANDRLDQALTEQEAENDNQKGSRAA